MIGRPPLYAVERVPVLQNRVFATAAAARGCALGDVRLVQDATTGLVFNEAFDASLVEYDRHYNNIIWGAASKGVIYALLRERLGCPATAAVDVNPVKQGMHLPGTGLEVLSPAHCLARIPPGRRICVMNSNYLGEIRDMTNDRYTYEAIEDV